MDTETTSQANAPLHRRPQDTVGYCVECNKLVRRCENAQCPAGHPAQAVAGAIDVAQEEEVPTLPKFNWAAFFMPPLWGASHGAVIAGLIVLPLWIFMDSVLQSAVYRVNAQTPLVSRIGTYAITGVIVVASLALMVWFGKTAWGIAWRRTYGDGVSTIPLETFIKRERAWSWICIPFFVLIVGCAIYYWIVYLPTVFG